MKNLAGLVVLLVAAGGCSPGVISRSMVDETIGEASWRLVADGETGLVDITHVDFGKYPNPKGLAWMDVVIADDGTVCAHDGTASWCGGPLRGIPYLTVVKAREDGYCLRVTDIFGNDVRTGCSDTPLTEDLMLDTEAPQLQGEGGASQLGDDVALGTRLVIEAINTSLEKIGLETRVSLPDTDLVDFEQGDIAVGEGSCKDVLEYLDDEFSDDHPGTDDYVFGPEAIAECLEEGRCRVGQIVTRAMAEVCANLPEGAEAYAVETGVVGGGGHAVGELCEGDNAEIDRCVGSPLVLDLAADGLQLQAAGAGATFALFAAREVALGWLAGSDDALLALDLDGDGAITSGRELFGEATARDGFAALARHDENGDGLITAADPVFERLLAWHDDGDGRSAPHELVPLAALGVEGLALDARRSDQRDAFGNELGLWGSARGAEREIPLIDVWFSIGTAR